MRRDRVAVAGDRPVPAGLAGSGGDVFAGKPAGQVGDGRAGFLRWAVSGGLRQHASTQSAQQVARPGDGWRCGSRMGGSGTPLDSVGLVYRASALTWATRNSRTRGGQDADSTRRGMAKKQVSAHSDGWNGPPVKPSAQPTLVRTQHLPLPAEMARELGIPGFAGCCFRLHEVPLCPSESGRFQLCTDI